MPRISKRGIVDEGRPLKDIDPKQVETLAAINCSYEEMAAVLDCDESTLTKRFSQAIKKGRANGRMSLKRKQWEVAHAGNVTMLIWLGKQLLEQTEKVVQTTHLDAKIDSTTELDKAQAQLVETIAASLESKNGTKS